MTMTSLRGILSVLAVGLTATALSGAPANAAEEKVLNVYNWVDYIGETTIEDFEKETGIKVVYDTYDSSETVDAKLMAGSSGYDILIHAGSFIPRLIQAGIFQKVDKSKLPNFQHLDPKILGILENWDPGNEYGVPYMWGTTGFTYNLDMINERMPDAPLDSGDMVFKPEIVSKFADCGVTLLDSPVDVIPMALSYLGLDPNTTDPDDYAKVEEMMAKVRPYIKTFDSSQYLTALPNSEVCLAMTWSGDYATASYRAEEAGIEINLGYRMPKEGSGAWFDVWVIPVDAPHPENAYIWLDYMMRPEVIAAATDYTYYANANMDANALVDPEITADPAIYPSDELLAGMFTSKVLPPKIERVRTRTWSKIKTGQ